MASNSFLHPYNRFFILKKDCKLIFNFNLKDIYSTTYFQNKITLLICLLIHYIYNDKNNNFKFSTILTNLQAGCRFILSI